MDSLLWSNAEQIVVDSVHLFALHNRETFPKKQIHFYLWPESEYFYEQKHRFEPSQHSICNIIMHVKPWNNITKYL